MACLNPQPLGRDGILVPCRLCWKCRLTRVNDLVGRSLAEGAVSDRSYFVTLTYGRNSVADVSHERATILTTRDWQLFMKRLRFALPAGTSVRYLAMGEYGSLRGRAHWHGILHFKGPDALQWPEDERFHSSFWSDNGQPIGFVYVQSVNYLRTKYICKYVLKDHEGAQSRPLFSRFPPLGEEYFQSLARQAAAAGLPPKDLSYSFRVGRATGQAYQKFYMSGVTAERYLRTFISEYERLGREMDFRESPLVDDFMRYGRIVKHDNAREAASADYASDLRLAAQEAKMYKLRHTMERYGRPQGGRAPSSMGDWFFRMVFDNGSQRQGWADALKSCHDFDPDFDPFDRRWAKLRAKYGVFQRD